MKDPHIPWHPAFIAAVQLELEEYQDSLEFYPEYQLTTEPLQIDCVIIKKAADVKIDKNFAANFKEINLLEFKSPDDYVSVKDFYKIYGYACQYVYLKKVSITNLTITFFESHYPKRLLEHLRKIRKYKVEESYSGIYNVIGDILPIQIIDSKKLSIDENLWLRGLSNKLDPLSVLRISDAVRQNGSTAHIKAYLYAKTRANFQTIEEAMNMSTAAKSLDEVLERTGYNKRVEEQKALKIAKKMISTGFPIETVCSITELEPEKVMALYQEVENG